MPLHFAWRDLIWYFVYALHIRLCFKVSMCVCVLAWVYVFVSVWLSLLLKSGKDHLTTKIVIRVNRWPYTPFSSSFKSGLKGDHNFANNRKRKVTNEIQHAPAHKRSHISHHSIFFPLVCVDQLPTTNKIHNILYFIYMNVYFGSSSNWASLNGDWNTLYTIRYRL